MSNIETSIMSELTLIQKSKSEIKSSIESKGVLVGDTPFSKYGEKIELIESDVGIEDLHIIYNWDDDVYYIHNPNGKYVPGKLFYGYPKTKIYIGDSIEKIGSLAFSGIVNPSDSIRNLKELRLSPNLKTLEDRCLSHNSLTELNLPIGVKELPSRFTYSSLSLLSLNMPGGGRILNEAMKECSKLKDVTLGSEGNPVNFIAYDAMKDCPNLKRLIIYVSDLNETSGLGSAPWGATNATIEYLQV